MKEGRTAGDFIAAILTIAGVSLWFWEPDGAYYVVARYIAGTLMVCLAFLIKVHQIIRDLKNPTG